MGLVDSLDVASAGARARRGEPGPGAALEDARILVAGAPPESLRQVRGMLRHAGAIVLDLSSSQTLLGRARGLELDGVLVWVDAASSSMLGGVRDLRAHDETADLPVLALAGRRDLGLELALLDAGASDFVDAPIVPRVVLLRLANLVALHQSDREVQRLVEALQQHLSRAAVADRFRQSPVDRQMATLLFSDLRGFSSSVQGAAAEPVFEAVQTALQMQSDIVRHWGGTVDQLSADGLLAVFCDERGAWQACRAALEIRQWACRPRRGSPWEHLPISMALHHGEVLRGDISTGVRPDYTVLGRPVHVTARMCGAAKSLEILVSDRVLELAGDEFEFSERQRVSIKGVPGRTYVSALQSYQPMHLGRLGAGHAWHR